MASKGSGMLRSRAQLTSRKLGGKKLLGVEVRSEADLIPVIERGLPLESLSALARDGLSRHPKRLTGSSFVDGPFRTGERRTSR